MIKWAQDSGIVVGPGRGSGPGSIIAYLLGITQINPLEHDLLFERFLNPARKDLPDIDSDFQSDRRDEVIDYIKERYGEDCVARIPTISKYKLKGALRDLSRIEGVPIPRVNSVTKKVISGMDLDDVLRHPELEGFFIEYPRIKRLLPELYGSARHRSLHAAGVVVTPKPIDEYLSIERVGKEKCICFDKDVVEDLGFCKLDILGLRTLNVIAATLKLIEKNHGVRLTERDLPINLKDLNDPKVYEIFKKGLTLGIFQFETDALMALAKQLEVDNFQLLTDATGLIRPGPLHSGDTKLYIYRKESEDKVTYETKLLEPTLNKTFGVIIYQEQIMEIVNQVAGLSLSTAEKIRKLVSKSKGSAALDKYKKEFIYGAMNNGVSEESAKSIWNKIREAGSYSFNKSHAVAYSVITYWCAYLKTYYPREFLIALMEFEEDEILNKAVLELRDLGYDVKLPDINQSEKNVSITEKNEIIFGLSNVKNVGNKAMEDIIENRPYEDFEDFMAKRTKKKTNARVVRHLIQAGAFDKMARRDELYYKVTPNESPEEWSDKTMTLKQMDVLEMPPKVPVSDYYKNPFRDNINITKLKDIDWDDPLDEIYVKGTLKGLKQKDGYAYVNISDGTDNISVLLSEEQINLYKDLINFDGNTTIILKAHMVNEKNRLYSDMMIDLDKIDDDRFELEKEYMENGREEAVYYLQHDQGINGNLSVVVSLFYFTSKRGNKGCRVTFANGEQLLCFQNLIKPLLPGQIVKYRISKKPFIEIVERW
jgi:DNA-directed DNA polymerase III PolC